jgi:PIN domain nuclease of toxin-antitoxin system
VDLLLDTHAFIWFLNGDTRLPAFTKNLIEDTSNKCFLSVASVWEIAIKVSLNKLELRGDFSQITNFLAENDIEVLPITFEHTQRLLHIQFHHRDPFDRIIIAQAHSEKLTIATKDEVFHKYEVNIIWT